MSSKAWGLLAILPAAAFSGLVGCYTVLKHPPTPEIAEGGVSRRDCFECHSPAGPAHAYDPMFRPGFDYYTDYFFPYYSYPWWYREYWLYGPRDAALPEAVAGDDSRRHLWGRGPVFTPPFPFPVAADPANPPSTSAESQDGSQQPGRTMKDSSGGNGTSNGSRKDEKKDEKKKEERTVWGRGGNKP